ncbi:MAG: type V CRISPR-associated protein Cas4 [Omnitrophica WOR_2 bacterium GWF2_38_59]|nr:MAG: type V CRISPR-associated protein Cas4 [Omnitrophica WOR_2 bacterium GWF2_38_59]OGX47428.1 MAG: type V CRISPR-associated protein Cas4 [Omnitrophica WOR_2 bacterium RIFOXYA2_FULL_38_17]OGX57998.1 MAG: type V CRISPR-associated protein Cas4 [Omnitrophica WOR_2 bacterium RIFOXYB2_FULL_38_16]OGX59222.1 MAG: type V CRISPR-associated protein Cas4 [Omnitrophica WOR_2 bacterium RIFOXYC2_FULL_38_12]
MYHTESQIRGKAAHEAIDEQNYTTRKNVLQGMEVYCQKYGLCGKIDIYDQDERALTERKKHIEVIYDGYVFQIYAQYFCLTEMGYSVEHLLFYSSDTNKKYNVKLPKDDPEMFAKFEKLIEDMNNCNLNQFNQTNAEKCKHCVYAALCDQALC